MFSIKSLVPACRASWRKRIKRAIEMGDHTIARHRKQRIGLAGTDNDPACSQFAGAANELHQQIEGVAAHLLRRRGDIHVDIGHVDGHQPQPGFAKFAQAAERGCIKLGRPEQNRDRKSRKQPHAK